MLTDAESGLMHKLQFQFNSNYWFSDGSFTPISVFFFFFFYLGAFTSLKGIRASMPREVKGHRCPYISLGIQAMGLKLDPFPRFVSKAQSHSKFHSLPYVFFFCFFLFLSAGEDPPPPQFWQTWQSSWTLYVCDKYLWQNGCWTASFIWIIHPVSSLILLISAV